MMINNDPNRYNDIIDLPHHQSSVRPHMSMHDRAAQFASFKAMKGLEEMIEEESRITDRKPAISEEEKALLDLKHGLITKKLQNDIYPEIAVTYFIPDETKSGVRIETVFGRIKKSDRLHRRLIFFADDQYADGKEISFDQIIRISGETVDFLDVFD